jgi:hypothetical protein
MRHLGVIVMVVLASACLVLPAPYPDGGNGGGAGSAGGSGGELIGSARRTLGTLVHRGVTLLNDSITYYTNAGDDDYEDERHFFSLHTRYALEDIVREGDDQEAVEQLLADSRLAFSGSLYACMAGMIEAGRNACFKATLSRALFDDAHSPCFNRNAGLTRLLQDALGAGNVEAADHLLSLQPGFSIVLGDGDRGHLWRRAAGLATQRWNLDDFRLLVFKNGGRAADLAPTPLDVEAADRAADMLLLIDLALFCDEEAGRAGRPRAFDASRFLNEGVLQAWSLRGDDAGRSEVARRLCQLGAQADWAVFDRSSCRGHAKSEAVLRAFERNEPHQP